MALTTVNSDGVKNDSIKNIDIKSDAAIEGSKLDNPLQLPDDHKISFGTTGTGDLEIYHSSGNSFIHDGGDGGLYIRGSILGWRDAGNSNASWINTNSGAGVELYYAGNNKFQTITSGVNVTGNLEFAGDTNTALHHPAADTLAMTTAGYERFRIDSAGNATFASTGGNQYIFKSDSFCVLNIVADSNTDESNTDAIIRFKHADDLKAEIRWDESDNVLRMGTGDGTDNLVVASNGNVGIGTDTPSYDAEATNLVLAFTGHGGMTIASTEADKRTNIYFADASSGSGAYAGGFTYDHDTDKMILRTGSNSRMTWTNDGNVEIDDGDLLMGATGHGINFSAAQTNASGMTSETLNSYEEGTFTPSNSVGITLTNNNPAYYIKIGKLVHIQMDISFSGVSDSSQVGYIQSLPFTSTGTTNHYAQGSIQHISENGGTAYDEDQNGLLMFVAPSESRIDIIVGGNGSVATRAHLEGRRFRISMFYKSAS